MHTKSTFAVAVVLLAMAAPTTVQADTTSAHLREVGTTTAHIGRAKTSAVAPGVAPDTTPGITAPDDASIVSGEVPVTASSTAAKVRFATAGDRWVSVVDVANGEATTTLDSYGLGSALQTLTASDCDAAENCGTTSDEVSFTVNNGPLDLTQPSDGAVVGTSFVAAASSSGGTIQFRLDGANVAAPVVAAPYQATINTSAIPPGPHVVDAVRCSADKSMCDVLSQQVTITVDNTISVPTSATPSRLSPNGDGRYDVTTLHYALDSAQSVKWSVTNSSGTTVRGPVNLGSIPTGSDSFVFNGRSNSRKMLPSGGYTIRLDTTKDVGGTTVSGHAQRGVVIDVTKPRGINVHATPRKFYPVKDTYKDATALHARVSENLRSLRMQIFDHAGHKIRTVNVGRESVGRARVTWNGRKSSGALVAAGRYKYRLVMRDTVGNTSVSGKHPVSVSLKKLVKRLGRKTVTPEASDRGAVIGHCSEVLYPARPNWPGSYAFMSNYHVCSNPSDSDEIAMTEHGVKLPASFKYGPVRVSTFGVRDRPGSNDHGTVLYVTRNGDVSSHGANLGPSKRWHSGDWVKGKNYVTGGRQLRWWAGSTLGNFYDIRSFKVFYTYYVLR
jgi:flagellar hook assembly protein FlgD